MKLQTGDPLAAGMRCGLAKAAHDPAHGLSFHLQILPRRRRVNGQRVHAAGKLAGQRRIDHAMALEPALPAKGFRHDIEPEMRFAAGPMAGMAFVPVRFILDMKALGCESVAQLFRDQIAGVHDTSMIPKSGKADFPIRSCSRVKV
jgi:hypothetical protein